MLDILNDDAMRIKKGPLGNQEGHPMFLLVLFVFFRSPLKTDFLHWATLPQSI
jgi:hypothetical protein